LEHLLPVIRRIVKRGTHTVVDLSESANLYLTARQGEAYEAVVADQMYRESIAAPLAAGAEMLPHLLRSIATGKKVNPVTIVDCGPATAEESLRKLDSLRQVVTVLRYVVVDVNPRLVSKVKTGVVHSSAVPVTILRRRFEELDPSILRQHITGGALLLFGSTGMNYESAELVHLLRKLCFSGMLVSLESLLRDDEVLTRGYESEAVIQFAFAPLSLLGASREQFEFRPSLSEGRVSLEFVAKRRTQLRHPEAPVLQPGDRVRTAFSRRPTLYDHQQEVGRILGSNFNTFVLRNRVAASLGCFL